MATHLFGHNNLLTTGRNKTRKKRIQITIEKTNEILSNFQFSVPSSFLINHTQTHTHTNTLHILPQFSLSFLINSYIAF